MKLRNLLIPVAAVFFLASCQPEPIEDMPGTDPDPVAGEKRKMLVEETIYDQSGNPDHKYYYLYKQDTAARTITCWVDTLTDEFERRYYDANGRLQKIFYNNADETVPASKDSLMITRVSANQLSLKYSWDPFSFEAVTTSLPGGRTQVTVTRTDLDPNIYNTRLFFNVRDALDSIMIASNTAAPVYYYKKEVFYDAGGKPVSDLSTSWQAQTTSVFTRTQSFTKDAKDNQYLLSFTDKLCGSDLGWMKYYLDWAPTDFFDYAMTDQVFLLQGTMQSMIVNTRETHNGTPTDDGPYQFTYPTQYNAAGRIVSWEERNDGKIQNSISIKYYD